MIITSSNVNMASNRSYRKHELSYTAYQRSMTSLGVQTTPEDFQNLIADKSAQDDTSASGQVSETPSSLEDIKEMLSSTSETMRTNLYQNQLKQVEDVRRKIIQYLMKLLFGQDEVYDLDENLQSSANQSSSDATYSIGVQTNRYTTYYEFHEDESVSLSTTGTVQTADGRSIDFGVNLNLTRSFTEVTSTQVDYSQPILIDPLVINVDASFVGLSDQTFTFDLDSDGTADEMKGLAQGSGFLALDKNENGIIDNGSELFGTTTGNGFEELGEYDEDGNGWIDEADSVFSKLKVWCKEKDGTDKLIDLKDAGVGAIYLGSAAGDFSLTDESNQTDAIVRRHGIFLYEDGNVGTIQQVDMAAQADYSA